ncbi:hypothetical protein QJS04_geneDACA000586 [Acorus gramineus]|uniref:Ribosomal protein L34e superfamily protein n=1 Tax=Acorus gramineus TaxID=55184 RepID=A0AAV9ATI3_ACOGR|nr:hypothetical protein QJS04_geneDACA000586 [Acorus gramineus]
MVDSRVLMALSEPSDRLRTATEAPIDHPSMHLKQTQKKSKQPSCPNSIKDPPCDRSWLMVVVDITILLAVLCACGFLLFPYAKLVFRGIADVGSLMMSVLKDEEVRDPLVLISLGFGFLFALIAFWAAVERKRRKCGKRGCRGLQKAPAFDIQLETGKSLKNSSSNSCKDCNFGGGFFGLDEERRRELEMELKKIAPLNGRAVLVFRARCGCSVGRMAVWGPKKLRKVKK